MSLAAAGGHNLSERTGDTGIGDGHVERDSRDGTRRCQVINWISAGRCGPDRTDGAGLGER
ncbi:hypothetical protein Vau01_111950 [Virgisporangium aurantiacum]|uniref:Uncharacterized protein n=1 Tax=Virgisporangium aurantiacum TaxID=175570 RepID=A0A8J3ZGG1_9ACTN|nr:hypothetical protein Vau01_111950 [Virgisporangium aurantiacum]